jgi:hypothetical protein
MRLAADTLAPQAIAGASRRRVASGIAYAAGTSTTWRTSGNFGFVNTKPSCPMVMIPVNKAHAGNLTNRRLSEASP